MQTGRHPGSRGVEGGGGGCASVVKVVSSETAETDWLCPWQSSI